MFIFTNALVGGNGLIFAFYVAYQVHIVCLLLFIPFLLAATGSLFATTWVDPGIIPRGLELSPNATPAEVEALTSISVCPRVDYTGVQAS